MALVYIIRNKITGKAYIGQHVGTRLDFRWREHVWHAKSGSTHPLHRSIRKHGIDAFEVVALSTFAESKHSLDQQEIFYISKYRTRNYPNRPPLSYIHVPVRGFKHRQETKDKIGNSNRGVSRGLGHPVSKKTRKKIGDSNRGVTRGLGRLQSTEQKQKNSESPGHRSSET